MEIFASYGHKDFYVALGYKGDVIKKYFNTIKNDWKINGQKEWIVNARHAKLAIVFVQTKSAGDKSGIAGFAVDLNDVNAKRSSN